MTKTTKKGKKPVKKQTTLQKTTYKFKKSSPLRKTSLVVVALLFGFIGVMILRASFAQSPLKPFEDNPGKGWVWKGLRKGATNGKCKDLYEVVPTTSHEAVTCSHGPDPSPAGVDVTATRTTDDLVADTVTGTGDATSAGSITCVDDGVSGNRVQAVYAVASDKVDRYSSVVGLIKTWAGEADKAVNDSAAKTGGVRHIRFVTDSGCTLNVAHVVLSPSGDDSFNNEKSELSKLGYNMTNRKYLVWTDANVYCGMSNLDLDDRPTQDNPSNGGNTAVLFARVDQGCWGRTDHLSELHELVHTLGGVQTSAPHATNYGHCTDEYDAMCYNDQALKAGTSMTYPCASNQEWFLDCNNDDYFNTNPASGSYLSLHWDVASSSFLTSAGPGGSTGGTITPPPPPPAGDTTAPMVNIISPSSGTTVPRKAITAATGSDNIAVTKMEVYIDGILKTTSTGASVSYTWNTRNISTGAHTIVVKDYDAAGNVGTKTETVYK